MRRSAVLVAALLPALASAHHSYASFDLEERSLLSGRLLDVLWENPHIVFIVEAEGERIRVEWVTLSGAERTGVHQGQFSAGDSIEIIASRHEDPAIKVMTVVKEIRLPASNWRWESPRNRGARPLGTDSP
jgi:hypothetical protein